MSRLVMKDGKIVMEDDNSQKNAAQKTNSQGSLSMKDGKIVMAQQTPAVNAQKNAQYLARTRAAQNAYLEQDRIPTRPTRDNVMDMAINSLRNRVANSTIGRAANEWASRVSGNIQNVLNESPEVRAAKRQARADNEARRQQWAIDNANIIDQASAQYEGPTRTETVRGKFTDTEGADMFSNDWEPGEEKEIEYTRTVRNENYNPLSREDRDALISRYADAMNGNTDANGYQQTLYDVTKNGGIEQLYKEQQADAANDREYGRQLRGVNLDDMSFFDRLWGTASRTVSGAGKQIASSGVGALASQMNTAAMGLADDDYLTSYKTGLNQLAQTWYYGIVNGKDDSSIEERVRKAAAFYGGDAYADAVVNRIRERAEQDISTGRDFSRNLLDDIQPEEGKIWENTQNIISDAGIYDAINSLQEGSQRDIQYAKDVNLLQNRFGDNLVEAGVSTIQNAADAAMAATLGLSGTGVIAMIPFALRAYGGSYAEQLQQATELGGVIGQDVAKKAAQSAGLSSAIEVGTEMMWGMVGAMSKVTGGGALDDAAQQRLTEILSGWAKTETGRKILTTVGEKALGGITEGLEEVIGDAAEQILKNAGIMPGEGEEFSEWMKNAGHSFVTGALGGLLGEVTSVVSSPLQKSQIGKQLKAGGLDISLNELADLANSEGMENTSLAKVYNDTFSGMPRNIESISDLEAGKLYEAYEEMLGKRSEAIYRIEQMQAKVEAGEELTRADVNRITNNSDAVAILAENGAVSEDAFKGGINERRDAVEMALRSFANDSTALSETDAENVQSETENANTAVSAPNPFLTMSNSAIDNIVQNAQPMSPAQSIRESNASNMLAGNVLRSAARVVDAAERLNVSERGQDVMARMYSPNMDAIDYVGEMTKYYNQGKEGKTFDVGSIEGVSAIQAQAAFNAGRQEYIERSNNGEEGLRVRTSSERQNGQSAGGSTGVLEKGAGAAQSRQAGSFQREGGYAEVSSESLRQNAEQTITNAGLRVVTNSPRLASAKKYAESHGMNLVAWEGGSLVIDGQQSRGYYDPETNTIYVRADHRLFTAEQITIHETTHGRIHNGEISLGRVDGREETVDLKTVYKTLVKELGIEKFEEVLDAYVEIYAGINISRQGVFEEMICDAMAGMNDFVSAGHFEDALKHAAALQTAKVVTEENAANGTRAGPVESTGKMSVEKDNVKPGAYMPRTSSEMRSRYTGDDAMYAIDQNGRKYSIDTMEKDIVEKKFQSDLVNKLGWDPNKVKLLVASLEDLIDYMKPDRDILDLNQDYTKDNRPYSPYKPNSDPLYKISLDYSTLCRKRLMTQYIIEKLQLREHRPMSGEEQIAIRDMLKEYREQENGLQVACAMCYVEAARLKSPDQMNRYFEDPTPVLKNYFAQKNKAYKRKVENLQKQWKKDHGYDSDATKDQMKKDKRGNGAADVEALNAYSKQVRQQYDPAVDQKDSKRRAAEIAAIEKAKTLSPDNYLSAENLAKLKAGDDTNLIYDAYTSNIRSATRSKGLETDVPYYYGDSRRKGGPSDKFIQNVNAENGMRFSSWSDFQFIHLLDQMMATIDLSVRKAAMHGYTKFPEQVRIFGKTGAMFNMSGVSGGTGFNADGSLYFSPTESIDFEEAKRLREEFPDTAGLQCIGINEKHTRALLQSDFIDYVIPYHVSGLNATLRKMAGISGWKDYTSVQEESPIDSKEKWDPSKKCKEKEWHKTPVFSEFFDKKMYTDPAWKGRGVEAMRAAAQKYIEMCHDRGLHPKFEEYTNEANYWKLLIDRKMVNQKTGDLIQQRPVTPDFDFDVIKNEIKTYVDNYRQSQGIEERALKYITDNWDQIPGRIETLKKEGAVAKNIAKAEESEAFAREMERKANTLGNEMYAAAPKNVAAYKYSRDIGESNFNSLYETMADGRIRPTNIDDLSTEDWKLVYKAVNKLGYGLESPKQAKEIYSRYAGQYGFNKEQSEAIKKAYGVIEDNGVSANPKREALARKTFGTTGDFSEAGYLMRNGSMLDFSGKKDGGPSHVRYMDHREIADVFEDGEIPEEKRRYGDATAYMNAFISEGNIRLMDGQGVTIGEMEPTSQQYTILKQFVDRVLRNHGYFYLDLSSNDGHTIASRDYYPADGSAKVIRDIKEYFKNGELPYRSSLSQFFSRDLDTQYMAAAKSGDTETAQRLVDEAARAAGYTVKAYHGTHNFGRTKFNADWPTYLTSKPGTARAFSGGVGPRSLSSKNSVDSMAADELISAAESSTYMKNIKRATKEQIDDAYRRYNDYGKSNIDSARAKGEPIFRWSDDNYNDGIVTLSEIKADLNKVFNNARKGGTYTFYVNPGDALTVYGDGAYYTSIPVDGMLAETLGKRTASTDEILKVAADLGFDSVIYKDIAEGGDYGRAGRSDVYAVVRPDINLKSADPITYDDAGNIIPLSERFNSKNDDIRFSRDLDSAGNKLSAQQAEYFKDSKVRDENGNLLVMYHGTKTYGFTKFRYGARGVASFFTPQVDVAESYSGGAYVQAPDDSIGFDNLQEAYESYGAELQESGNGYKLVDEDGEGHSFKDLTAAQAYLYDNYLSKDFNNSGIYPVYLNIKKPYVIDAEERAWNQIPNWDEVDRAYEYAMLYAETGEDLYEIEYAEWGEDTETKEFTWDELKKQFGKKGAQMLRNGDEIHDVFLDKNGEELKSKTDDWAAWAEQNGYDGVIFRNIYDGGDEASDVYVTFNPEQVKSVYNQNPTKNPDIRYSLDLVAPVEPSSEAWKRTKTTEEAMRIYPNLWNVAAEESEKRNPTQVSSTQSTYRRIYDILKKEGFSGKILDASSGLGIGTRVGREEYGFDVDDIEPYPGDEYEPKYRDYSKLNKKYDAIISSAVLNVLPQDQRDALVVKMGKLLNPGGRIFVTTRGKEVEDSLKKSGKNIRLDNMEWIETSRGSYQKGFTDDELKAYLEDALGNGFTVEKSNASNGGRFNNNTSIVVTKNAGAIRFSRDLSNTELYEANRQLQKDLTELRSKLKTRTEQRDYWRRQTQKTEDVRLKQDVIKNIAKEVIKTNNSKADQKAVAEKLNELGNILLQTDNENWYDDARMKCYEIAHMVNESAEVLDQRGGEHFYKDFRDALKQAPIYVAPSVREEVAPDGWNDFRKAQFGTVNMTADQNKGKSVDTVYHDLQATFGEWLLPEYVTSEADQLNKILEVVETYRPIYENMNSYEMAEANEWVANEILTRTMELMEIGELRQEDSTRADIARERLNAEKQKSAEALKQVRQQRDRKVADLKAHYQQMAEDRRNRKIDSEMRSRLLKIAKRLNNKKLDRVTRGLLDQYIGELDLVSKGILGRTVKELETLQAWYDSYKESMGDDFIPDKFIERKIARLSKKHISDLTQEEVADLTTVLLNLETMIRTQNQLIESQIKMDAYAAGVQTIDDINNSNGRTGFLNKFISTETATPEREIHRITGYRDSSPLYKAAKELSDGQRKMLDYQMRAEALFKKWTTDKKFIRRIAGKHAEEITVSGYVNGKLTDVKITPAMRMALYLHEKNDDNMRHISKGGVKIPDMALYKKGKLQEAYDKATRVVFTRGMLKEIASKMSGDEKAFADVVDRYYNGMSRNEINDTSEALRGYAIAGVEHYYPIDTDGSFLKKEFDAIKRDGSIEGMGILKERIEGATNPIMLYDMNDTLNRSISQHSKYTGLAIPVRNFNKLYGVTTHNYETSVAETLKKNWGSAATSYIEKMMADVQNGTGLKSDAWGDLLARARSHYAGAVLNTNASVAMKQAASYPTAAAVVGYGPLMRALADVKKIDLDKLAQYTPLLWYRSKGFSTTELGDIGKEGGHIPKALNWIQAMDVATTTKLAKAAMYYVNENNNLTRGTDAWWKAVAEVYNRIIEETQPNYTMMQRPQILRSDNALTRALNMFKTQPFQNFNILYDAFGNLAAKSREYKANATEENLQALKSARTNVARAVSSQAVSAFIFALMQFAWDAFRGKTKKYKDDDDEMTLASWLKGMGINVLSSVGGMIPFGSYALELGETMTDAILKAFKLDPFFDQTFYGLSENAAESVNDMGNAMINMVTKTAQALSGSEVTESTVRSVVDSMGDIAQFAGIPINNVIKLAQAIGRNYYLATEGRYVGGYHALRLTTDPARYSSDYYDLLWKAYNNDKAACDEVLQLMLDDGFEEDKIKSAMEKRMKDAQGVSSVKDLESRWMAPSQQKTYDEGLADLEKTTMFQAATDEQQKALLTKLYNLALDNDAGKKLSEKIAGGADVGLEQNEYLLYTLALSMVDEPTESGKYGSYTNDEVEAAILMVPGLSKEERAYLWDAAGKAAKSNPWR